MLVLAVSDSVVARSSSGQQQARHVERSGKESDTGAVLGSPFKQRARFSTLPLHRIRGLEGYKAAVMQPAPSSRHMQAQRRYATLFCMLCCYRDRVCLLFKPEVGSVLSVAVVLQGPFFYAAVGGLEGIASLQRGWSAAASRGPQAGQLDSVRLNAPRPGGPWPPCAAVG